MDRRHFLLNSSIALSSALAACKAQFPDALSDLSVEEIRTGQFGGHNYKDGPDPKPEITALVDVLVPPDPEIPGDFKGSDYGADRVLAAFLGDMAQTLAVGLLDDYAQEVASVNFVDCTAEQQLEAISAWIRDRDNLSPLINDLLTGLLTVSVIGTYEENTEEEQQVLFESMGWFDPEDPAGTLRIPCEGYADSYQFPARLRRGVNDE